MNLLTAVVAVMSVSWIALSYQSLAIREARWEFYRLRDVLRDMAIRDASFAESDLFMELDTRMSAFATLAPYLSIWIVLPKMFFIEAPSERELWLTAQLARPENEALRHLHAQVTQRALQLLAERHIIIRALFRLVISIHAEARRSISAAVNAFVMTRAPLRLQLA